MECARRSRRSGGGPNRRGFVRAEVHGLEGSIQDPEFRFDSRWSVPGGQEEVGGKSKELQGIESRLCPCDSTSYAPIQDCGCLVRVLREDPHSGLLNALNKMAVFALARIDSQQAVQQDSLLATSRTAAVFVMSHS